MEEDKKWRIEHLSERSKIKKSMIGKNMTGQLSLFPTDGVTISNIDKINIFESLDKLADEIKEEISKKNIKFDSNGDGRIESSISESYISDILESITDKKGIPFKKMPDRSFCDVEIYNLPVNIKITKCKSSDNTLSTNTLMRMLEDGIDYYFLVVNKVTGDVFFNSLWSLCKVATNPSNPPFQVNWLVNDRLSRVYRDKDTAIDFLANAAIESIKKNIDNEEKTLKMFEYIKNN